MIRSCEDGIITGSVLSFPWGADDLSHSLLSLRPWWSGYCCSIGICFPTLQRRLTPGLILKMRILVSKQGLKTDFHDQYDLCRTVLTIVKNYSNLLVTFHGDESIIQASLCEAINLRGRRIRFVRIRFGLHRRPMEPEW